MKNITLSADEHLIEQARDWLASYAHPAGAVRKFDALMERLTYVRPGGKFAHDEMNER